MNIQALMKKAQQMQKDVLKEKEEIDKMVFEGKASFVTVTFNGKKEMIKVKIDKEAIAGDEIELVEDMILVATNDAIKKIDNMTETKLGKYSSEMSGLF